MTLPGLHAGPQPIPLADRLGPPPGCADSEEDRGILKDWDDLRFFLAVARLGSLSAASRVLKVDPATVGRRVSRLETALEIRCFERRADGYRLTGEGQKLLAYAERVEADLHGLARALDAEERGAAGLVTVTASDSVALPLLIPALPQLRDQHPGIRIDLISSNQVLSLARREADIAIRAARPEEGDLLTRRIGTMGYGLYAAPPYLERAGVPRTEDDLTQHVLLDWFEEYPRVPTASWFRRLAERSQRTMRLSGVKERLSAAQAGMGIACLSFMMARGSGLVRVLPELAVPSVELWLVTHPDSARAKRVRAVMDFIVGAALAANGQLSKPA